MLLYWKKLCYVTAARDVIANLNQLKTHKPQDFSWISQLRYYFENGVVHVNMITTDVAYAYEYLGNTGRLVITPLTDRCYRWVSALLSIYTVYHLSLWVNYVVICKDRICHTSVQTSHLSLHSHCECYNMGLLLDHWQKCFDMGYWFDY